MLINAVACAMLVMHAPHRRYASPLLSASVDIYVDVVVIGGGLAGYTAAALLAV